MAHRITSPGSDTTSWNHRGGSFRQSYSTGASQPVPEQGSRKAIFPFRTLLPPFSSFHCLLLTKPTCSLPATYTGLNHSGQPLAAQRRATMVKNWTRRAKVIKPEVLGTYSLCSHLFHHFLLSTDTKVKLENVTYFLKFFIAFSLFWGHGARACHGADMEVRRQLLVVGSLHLPCRALG